MLSPRLNFGRLRSLGEEILCFILDTFVETVILSSWCSHLYSWNRHPYPFKRVRKGASTFFASSLVRMESDLFVTEIIMTRCDHAAFSFSLDSACLQEWCVLLCFLFHVESTWGRVHLLLEGIWRPDLFCFHYCDSVGVKM